MPCSSDGTSHVGGGRTDNAGKSKAVGQMKEFIEAHIAVRVRTAG
jgi:hypothetical protein